MIKNIEQLIEEHYTTYEHLKNLLPEYIQHSEEATFRSLIVYVNKYGNENMGKGFHFLSELLFLNPQTNTLQEYIYNNAKIFLEKPNCDYVYFKELDLYIERNDLIEKYNREFYKISLALGDESPILYAEVNELDSRVIFNTNFADNAFISACTPHGFTIKSVQDDLFIYDVTEDAVKVVDVREVVYKKIPNRLKNKELLEQVEFLADTTEKWINIIIKHKDYDVVELEPSTKFNIYYKGSLFAEIDLTKEKSYKQILETNFKKHDNILKATSNFLNIYNRDGSLQTYLQLENINETQG